MGRSISRRELVRKFRSLGFSGPFAGGRHEFMKRDQLKVRIPNPHAANISEGLVKEILRQAGISLKEWDKT